MVKESVRSVLPLPGWLIKLCCWFWAKRIRVWSLIGSNVVAVLSWAIVLWLTSSAETWNSWPLKGVIGTIVHNWLIFTFILAIIFIVLIFFLFTSWLVSHASVALQPQVVQNEKQMKPASAVQPEQPEHDLKHAYLRYLQQQVTLLPPLGLGVSDLISPQGVQLADVFIPLEFRESPKALKLHPLGQDEIQPGSGLDRQHEDHYFIDAKGEWERTFMQRDRISINDLWACLSPERPAAVIQGAPGIGKSTLLSRIILSLTHQGLGEPDAQLLLTPLLLPILILIKEYADYLSKLPMLIPLSPRQKMQRSVQVFLTVHIEEQLKTKGIEAARVIAIEIMQWLRERGCLILFDGLDEVSDKALQLEIQQAISEFIEQQRHPDLQATTHNRFLITSRVAEYDAPALANYRYFLVAELTLKQISDFLPRWYRTSIIGSAVEVQERTEKLTCELISAIERTEAVRKLAENPLLLTLMAIMLYNGTQLPERRIELYQAVTKTLLESRNEVKGLPRLYEDEAVQCLGPLAFTMQGKGNNLARRTEVAAAIKLAIEFPQGSGMLSPAKVIDEVDIYIEAIGRRGGIFVLRTGDYYGFIHRSFQEYFVARYMLREIERDRNKKIKEFVKLVREDPNTWREPFILAVAFKSAGDGGPVADEILRILLSPKGKPILRDVLLAATCVIEAKYINLDRPLQRAIARYLVDYYAQAQKEQNFEDCTSIEHITRDWLLVLRAGESYQELPQALYDAICDIQHSERQCAALTLLIMIVERLLPARYDIYALLIPVLLALTGLDAVAIYQPSAQLTITTNLDVADLAFTLISFMGRRGPSGLLLPELRQYFKDHPQQLHDLARYSLACGTLITPTVVPLNEINYKLYEAGIGKWIELRDSYKPARITEQNTASCLAIQQALLDCAEEVSYPTSLHLKPMLQRVCAHPEHWRFTWQAYLLEQLDSERYVNYQEIVLFWTLLFPGVQDLQPLVDHIIMHYTGPSRTSKIYAQRFISSLCLDLRDLRDLRYMRNLREMRGMKYMTYLRYLIDMTYLRYLIDMMKLRDMIKLRDMRDMRDLRDLRDLIDLRDLRKMIFTRDIAEKVYVSFPSHDNSQDIDLLRILTGRILQIQENKNIGIEIEAEVQHLATAVLTYLKSTNMDVAIYEEALDLISSLPTRTEHEIQFVWQIVDGTADNRVHSACAKAFSSAKPVNDKAWKVLKQGMTTHTGAVRDAVEERLNHKNLGPMSGRECEIIP